MKLRASDNADDSTDTNWCWLEGVVRYTDSQYLMTWCLYSSGRGWPERGRPAPHRRQESGHKPPPPGDVRSTQVHQQQTGARAVWTQLQTLGAASTAEVPAAQ